MSNYIDIVFDGAPSVPAPRFVEVEDSSGASIKAGEWLQREDGFWVLRIQQTPLGDESSRSRLVEAGAEALDDLLTMLGVDPQEVPEHGGPSTAETLASAVLNAATQAGVPR